VGSAAGVHHSTGIAELDRVLGGGLVPASVTLLSGEPGIGKSTLVLQLLASIARRGGTALLATAEESAEQVRLRADRLGALHERVHVMAETVLPAVIAAARELRPEVLVVDSIQTVYDPDFESAPGSVAQVREGAAHLVRLAKEGGISAILVGHVTKEGTLAGPRVLEHLVDTVLSFEGDTHSALRLLRSSKNRFGSTGEVGVFEMTGEGLRPVPDPSGLFLADRREGASGSTVAAVMEGSRPLLVEVQAFVTTSKLTVPRRNLVGLDGGRIALLTGLLAKRLDYPFGENDVYAQAAGGVRITEPAADLAVVLALVSASSDQAVWPGLVAIGEVGLGGELRRVPLLRRRLSEAARLGFRAAVVPAGSPDAEIPGDIEAHRAGDIVDALRVAGLEGR
jgi:DNA repair protein RadA/Sms